MNEQPHIHFIEASNFKDCEEKVNAWIDDQPSFQVTILNVNVLPMMLEGKLVFLTIVMYTGEAAYAQSKGGLK